MEKEDIINITLLVTGVISLSFLLILIATPVPEVSQTNVLDLKPYSHEANVRFIKCMHNEKVIAENFNFNDPNQFDKWRCYS